jgi:hypothetical protein
VTATSTVTKYVVITEAEPVLCGVHEMITRWLDGGTAEVTVFVLTPAGTAQEVEVQIATTPWVDGEHAFKFDIWDIAEGDLVEEVTYTGGNREYVESGEFYVDGFPEAAG